LLADLERMRTASVRLNAFVAELRPDTPSLPQQGEPFEEFHRRIRHDLRTPLNAIKGYSELLIEDMEGDGENNLRDDLKKLKESADQLLGQVISMAALTRQEELGSQDDHRQQMGMVADVLRTLPPLDTRNAPTESSRPSRILVIDDNAANRDVLARRLRREGADVGPGSTGSPGRELVAIREFDLILLDLICPT